MMRECIMVSVHTGST